LGGFARTGPPLWFSLGQQGKPGPQKGVGEKIEFPPPPSPPPKEQGGPQSPPHAQPPRPPFFFFFLIKPKPRFSRGGKKHRPGGKGGAPFFFFSIPPENFWKGPFSCFFFLSPLFPPQIKGPPGGPPSPQRKKKNPSVNKRKKFLARKSSPFPMPPLPPPAPFGKWKK